MKLSILLEALTDEKIEEVHIKDMSQEIRQICSLSLTSVAFTDDIIYVGTVSLLKEIKCAEAP